jgi:arylformamidase
MPAQNHIPHWRAMDTATRTRAYSPSSVLPDGDLMPFIQRYIDKSASAYAAHPNVITLAYGKKPSNTIDLVMPVASGSLPLLVFIHGGYWQELSKRESFLPAPDTLARGMGFAAVDYTLAPQASIDDIVAECTSALETLIDRAADFGVDPARIVISGSSAGAHLAAMVCLRLPLGKRPCGALLMSGIFELEPLIGTYVNDPLGMTLSDAHRNSPVLCDLGGFPPAVVVWGRQETDEFKRQSRDFANLLGAAGCAVSTLEMAQRNHFDIVEDIANDTELGRRMAALTGKLQRG